MGGSAVWAWQAMTGSCAISNWSRRSLEQCPADDVQANPEVVGKLWWEGLLSTEEQQKAWTERQDRRVPFTRSSTACTQEELFTLLAASLAERA